MIKRWSLMEGNADIRNDSEWNGTSDEEDFIA
jgi:hypothetical protein